MSVLGHSRFLLGIAVTSPAEPIGISIVDQHLVTDHLGRAQTVELLQRHLERLPAGTSLEAAAKHITALIQHVSGHDDAAGGGPEILIDVSLFGEELAKLVRRPKPLRITVTAGGEEREPQIGHWTVPRVALYGPLVAANQRKVAHSDLAYFRTAELLPLVGAFEAGLRVFTLKPPQVEAEEALRDGVDRDLVTAAALCVWRAARRVPGRRGAMRGNVNAQVSSPFA